jgi:hypothetical protein
VDKSIIIHYKSLKSHVLSMVNPHPPATRLLQRRGCLPLPLRLAPVPLRGAQLGCGTLQRQMGQVLRQAVETWKTGWLLWIYSGF